MVFRITLLFCFVTLCAPAQQRSASQGRSASQERPLPLDSAVHTGRLANGLTYFIRHNENPPKRAWLYLVNKVGSVLEEEDQRGLAHFLEHMNFNGTKHYPKNQLEDFLQKAGVRFGADLNAYTSFDETVYMLPIPLEDAKMLGKGLGILRDWAQDALLDSADIDAERGVVLEEERMKLGAGQRLQQQWLPVQYNHSRYASRMPIGLHGVLTSFRPGQLRRFYHDWYRPDLQAVIVVGDVDVAGVEKMVRRLFGDLKNPTPERPRTPYRIPLTGKNQFLRLTDKELSATSFQLSIKHKGEQLRTLSEYRAALVRNLFAMMLGSRYADMASQPDLPFTSGGAQLEALPGGLDAFTVSAVAKPGQLQQAVTGVWREVRRVQQHGFTAEELDRAKTNLIASVDAIYKEKDKLSSADYVKECVEYFLHDAASPGIGVEEQLVHQLMPNITQRSIDSVTRDYVRDHDRDILLAALEKDSAGLPDEKTILSWLAAVDKENTTAVSDRTDTLPLLRKEPVPGKITREEKDTAAGLTVLTLSNGTKVLLKKTDYQDNQVLFAGFSDGGTSLYNDSDYYSASNAAALVSVSGAGNYDALQLRRLLTGRHLAVSTSITERGQTVSGSTSRADLRMAMQLLYALIAEPRCDTSLFNSQLRAGKAAFAGRGSDPGQVFNDSAQAILGGYHMRRMSATLHTFDQVDAEKAFRIYKERFADAGAFTYVFVGNIDEAILRPLLEKYLASLPGGGGGQAARDLHIHIPAGHIEKTFYKGREPRATVLLTFSGPVDYSYANAIRLSALKDILEIRLLERLREEESGVYSPGVTSSFSKIPESRYSLMISFTCSPANVDRLVSSTLAELNTLRTDGPRPVDLEKVKAQSRVSRETTVRTNGYWLNYLLAQLGNGEPLGQMNDYLPLLGRLTTGDLRDFASRYVGDKNYIRLVLMPEAARPPKPLSGQARPNGAAAK